MGNSVPVTSKLALSKEDKHDDSSTIFMWKREKGEGGLLQLLYSYVKPTWHPTNYTTWLQPQPQQEHSHSHTIPLDRLWTLKEHPAPEEHPGKQ